MKLPASCVLLLIAFAAAAAEGPRWRLLSDAEAPPAREGAASVWTGKELIVWGGFTDEGNHYSFHGDGGRLDPVAGSWRPLPAEGAPSARAWHSAVWTGKEMVVWGGEAGEDIFGDGAAYDPVANRWRTISDRGAPTARVEHSAVWTGKEMLILAGVTDERSFTGGGRYDPGTDKWRPLPSAEFLTGSREQGAVWTGEEAFVFGGINGSQVLRQGGRYDPVTDKWRVISLEGAPGKRAEPGLIWTGSHVVVFGGTTGIYDGPGAAGGAQYDPKTDRWASLPSEGAPAARGGHAMVWTGEELLVWGGGDCNRKEHATVFADGARWGPGQASWTRLTAENAPTARAHVVACWTGAALLVWAGVADAPRRDGGILFLR